MRFLANFSGSWTGTNWFRLMPKDQLVAFPATMTVTSAAGGHLASLSYTWRHPDDGPQDGLLVLGPGAQEGSLTALWGDSWHQQPTPTVLSGNVRADTVAELETAYGGGWRWRIDVDATGEHGLRMRMDNVVPADQASGDVPAGAYSAMVMAVRRA